MSNEIRVRSNFASGTGFTCTNVATSINNAGFANLPTIDTTNYCVIICDAEIMWVTAHAAASSTCTVLRGQEGTAAAAHTNAAWQHGPTAQDFYTPSCRIFNSASQSPANITETALTFDSERFDTDNMHSTSVNTSRITINTAGLYSIAGMMSWAANGTGIRQIGIRLNGATYVALVLVASSGAGAATLMNVGTLYRFAVNDYVELVGYQSSGGALAVAVNGNYSPEFTACRIGD